MDPNNYKRLFLVRECDGSQYDVLSLDKYRLRRFCVSHYQV